SLIKNLLFATVLEGLTAIEQTLLRSWLLFRGCPAQVIVPPLLHDRILQALKLQHVRVLARREDFQPVRLLPDPNLSPHLELPPPEPAPGCEALRVPPAQLPVLQPHLLHRVLHDHVRTEGLEFVGVVHDPDWSFCSVVMSRGGGVRPLHSLSCPSLKRRLREGRGTPDSAKRWLRGLDTPLSRSESWLPSCQ
uniref:Uncharacterized protein n=1 Tax=Oryzias latipes TaxID=8090 RepID=A0A3P9LHG5_ORYLA